MELQYTVGPAKVYNLKFSPELTVEGGCQAVVNELACRACEQTVCLSGREAWNVDCSNLDNNIILSGCSQTSGAGPLEFLADLSLHERGRKCISNLYFDPVLSIMYEWYLTRIIHTR